MDKTNGEISSAKSWRRHRVIIRAALLILAGLTYALWIYAGGPGIPCIFHTVTGLDCPACGITHMFTALLRLDFSGAWRANPVILCMLPIFIIVTARMTKVYIKTGKSMPEKWVTVTIWLLIVLLLAFGIIRNLI